MNSQTILAENMKTYRINKDFANTEIGIKYSENDELNLNDLYFEGNLCIDNTEYNVINLKDSKILGTIIISNNNSEINLTNARIGGNIIIKNVLGKKNIFLCGLMPLKNEAIKNEKFEAESQNINFQEITNNTIILENDIFKIELDRLKNIPKNFTLEKNNSIVLLDIEATLNISDSIIKGDLIIYKSTIIETCVISNTIFENGFFVEAVGFSCDIEGKNCHFQKTVEFIDLRFDKELYLKNSTFDNIVKFHDCTFYQEVYFQEVTFYNNVFVTQSIFQGKANFTKIDWRNNSKMILEGGNAFLSYVDLTNQYLNNYSFSRVKGLRNIFHSLLDNKIDNYIITVSDKKFISKLENKYPNLQLSLPALFNWMVEYSYIFSEEKHDKNIKLANLNQESEIYQEARLAVEDLSKQEIRSELIILEFETELKKYKLLGQKSNYYRLLFLKYATNFGESPFRIIWFILVYWATYTGLYYICFILQIQLNMDYNIHIDWAENSYGHENIQLSLLNKAWLQSTNNLLSLNSFFPCSDNIAIILLTISQGFINLMIIALILKKEK